MGVDNINGNADFQALMNEYTRLNTEILTQSVNTQMMVVNDTLNLTVTATNGEVITGNFELPQLDDAEEEPIETLESAIEALKTMLEQLEALNEANAQEVESEPEAQGVQASGETGGSATIFDIYTLLALCTEITRKIRETARLQRNAALQNEKAEIFSRAEEQRSAARYGMILGIVFAGAQALMAGLSAYKTISSAVKQNKMLNNSGLTDLSKNMTMTSKATSEANAHNLMTKTQSSLKMNADEVAAIRNEYFGEAGEQRHQLDAMINPPDPFEVVEPDIGIEPGAEVEMVDMADVHHDAPQEDVAVEQQPEEHVATEEEILQQRNETRDAYDSGMAKYDKAIADQRERVATLKAQNAPKADIKAAEARLKTLVKQRPMAKAIQLDGKVHASTEEQISADIDKVKKDFDAMDRRVEKTSEFADAVIKGKHWEAVQQLTNVLSGAFNGITQFATASKQASATEKEAMEKEYEDSRQENNEFFQGAQEVFSAVLRLATAVVDMENSTNEQIIRG